jgi:uncharacterized protein (TIGR01777 family)
MGIYAVSGSHGLIGQALCTALIAQGHTVRRVTRHATGFDWSVLDGADGIFHLAGRNIAHRWTAAFKATMLAERAAGVASLYAALSACPQPPKLCVVASAIGFYGDTRDTPDGVDEYALRGSGFAADICAALEQPLPPALARKTRLVQPRIGVVLARNGGALARMLPAFQLGLGGPLGTGQQRLSWVSLEDVVRILMYFIDSKLSGIINAVSPAPLPQTEFAKALGHTLRRPAFLAMPTLVVKLLFGEMGESLLLADCAVRPQRLHAAGFDWRHADIATALRAVLTR